MIAFDKSTKPLGANHYCAFVGRWDGKTFRMDDAAIMNKYGTKLKMWGRIPDALSSAMGNQMYVANLDTEDEMNAYFHDLLDGE